MPSFPFFREHSPKHEWIGGRYTFPIDIPDGKEVLRPEVILWMEIPDRILVGSKAIDPHAPATLAETLDEAMLYPVEGSPRQPLRIRVPDEQMAGELRRAFRGIPIIVAPVPELDELFEDLCEAARREANPSYFDGGATPAIVGEFFAAASNFFRAAPWSHIDEQQIIAVDIPGFDVQHACLSVVGAGAKVFGLLLFRSVSDFISFAVRVEAQENDEDIGFDSGDESEGIVMRSLSFERKKVLPSSLIGEIREHQWPVAGTKAYPTLVCLDGAMNHVDPAEHDFQIMTALAHAFLPFYEQHRALFAEEEPKRVVFTSDNAIAVTLTAPHPALDAALLDGRDDLSFDEEDPFVEPPLLITRSVGRNDPCPCGSGKKYKKCHLDADSR